MAIRWYEPRSSRKSSFQIGDFARVSNTCLKFSVDVHKNLFKEKPNIKLGYDEIENAICLAPGNEGLKIASINAQKNVMIVNWPNFLLKEKIHFDKPCDIKIVDGNGYKKLMLSPKIAKC